mmetsp:Transcript_67607/g.175568  ORF Transcript_67607/g.175568 Transcript_67607/m.175568 type:complete len:202 (-) Transcript_67607:154-759(-)
MAPGTVPGTVGTLPIASLSPPSSSSSSSSSSSPSVSTPRSRFKARCLALSLRKSGTSEMLEADFGEAFLVIPSKPEAPSLISNTCLTSCICLLFFCAAAAKPTRGLNIGGASGSGGTSLLFPSNLARMRLRPQPRTPARMKRIGRRIASSMAYKLSFDLVFGPSGPVTYWYSLESPMRRLPPGVMKSVWFWQRPGAYSKLQ